MSPFHELIRGARKNLGFKTAKEFHRKKNSELSMSYESYSNIEAGKYLPPADKLTSLAEALEIEDLKSFVFSFCQTLIPNELFKSFFQNDKSAVPHFVFRSDAYVNYKEKFQALLKFNQMQTRYELTAEQVSLIEKDLACWDIINLFITDQADGYSAEQITEKTNENILKTQKRLDNLEAHHILKKLKNGNFFPTQDAFILPRKPYANQLTYLLLLRELKKCYEDNRNHPYTRFRSMPISPEDRDQIEMFIDNFILDSRKFKKETGKAHYLQIVFSDRNDLC